MLFCIPTEWYLSNGMIKFAARRRWFSTVASPAAKRAKRLGGGRRDADTRRHKLCSNERGRLMETLIVQNGRHRRADVVATCCNLQLDAQYRRTCPKAEKWSHVSLCA